MSWFDPTFIKLLVKNLCWPLPDLFILQGVGVVYMCEYGCRGDISYECGSQGKASGDRPYHFLPYSLIQGLLAKLAGARLVSSELSKPPGSAPDIPGVMGILRHAYPGILIDMGSRDSN